MDLPDTPAAPGTAGGAPQFGFADLGTPEPASLQEAALRADMPVWKPIGRQEAWSLILADFLVSDGRKPEPIHLQPRLKWLVMNALIVQKPLLDGQLVPRLKARRHNRDRRAVLASEVDDRARAIACQNLTSANLADRFHGLVPLSDPPSSRTYDADASTERNEFGVGLCPENRALFPRSAAASAEVRRASL